MASKVSMSVSMGAFFDLKSPRFFFKKQSKLIDTITFVTSAFFSTNEASKALEKLENLKENQQKLLESKLQKNRVEEAWLRNSYLDLESYSSRSVKKVTVIDSLDLETNGKDCLLHKKLSEIDEEALEEVLCYLEAPLTVIADPSHSMFFKSTKVRLPSATFHFFSEGLRGNFPQKSTELMKGSFGSVTEETLKEFTYAYKMATEKDYEATQLFKEAAVFMLLNSTLKSRDCISSFEAMDPSGIYFKKADGDLRDYCQANELSIKEIVETLNNVANVLIRLHELGFIYRDLKTENILYKKTNSGIKAVLCDFGGVISENQIAELPVGCMEYLPPEIITAMMQQQRVYPYSKQGDSYSFGVLIYELTTGFHPIKFYENRDKTVLSLEEEQLISIAEECLNSDPNQRLSMEEICNRLKMVSISEKKEDLHPYGEVYNVGGVSFVNI